MVSDEKTPLLGHVVLLVPKETAAAAAVPGPVLAVESWSGLTNRELMALAQEPFWVRLRALTFWGFWACWLVLLTAALCVVLTSPPCPDTSCDNSTDASTLPYTATDLPTTVTLEAWTTMVPR